MRRINIIVLLLTAIFALYLAFPRKVNQGASAPAPTAAEPQHIFHNMMGVWGATYQFIGNGTKEQGFQTCNVLHSGNDLWFSVYMEKKPAGKTAEPASVRTRFMLTDERKQGYKLNVYSESGHLAIEELRLTYEPGSGFRGEGLGTLNGEQVPVQVSIKVNGDGTHEWKVREKSDKPENKLQTFYNIRFEPTPTEAKAPAS